MAAISPWIHRRWPRATAGSGALLAWGLLALWLHRWGGQAFSGAPALEVVTDWVPSLGWKASLYIDALSLLFCGLVLGIGGLICLYSGAYFKGKSGGGRFFLCLLGFMAAMLGVVSAGNLFWMFLFWELTSLTSFLLISFHFDQAPSRRAALQALWVTGAGGVCLLLASLWLESLWGSVDFSQILGRGEELRAMPEYPAILALFLLAAFTKSAQFPFHFWLPNAMQAPTPVSAYLHSATMVKAGIFLLARLHPLLGSTPGWFYCLTGVGALTMLMGAWMSLRQTDLKLLLAWTTLSALGSLTLLLGIGSAYAIQAFVVLLLAHACYKGCFFLWVGVLDLRLGTRDCDRLAAQLGRFKQLSLTGWIGGASMIGLPPCLGFLAKELSYEALLPHPLLLATVSLSNLLLIAAVCQLTIRLLLGVPAHPIQPKKPISWQLWLPPALLAGAGLGIGCLPSLLGGVLVEPTLTDILAVSYPVKLSLWHGFNAVLALSLGVLLLGLGLGRRHRVLLSRLPRLSKGSWDGLYDGLLRALIAISRTFLALVQHGKLRFYLGMLFVFSFGLIVWKLRIAWSSHPTPALTPLDPVGVGLSLLIAGSALATVRAATHLASIASLGLLGFLMALLFVHFSAPDAAMTQFLVETLGVLLVTLVLIHLPSRTRLAGPFDSLRDYGIALLGGLAFAGTAWLISSVPFESPLTEFYASTSYLKAYGKNVVNVILVDFRGLDTLGELVVLAVAGLGVAAMVRK